MRANWRLIWRYQRLEIKISGGRLLTESLHGTFTLSHYSISLFSWFLTICRPNADSHLPIATLLAWTCNCLVLFALKTLRYRQPCWGEKLRLLDRRVWVRCPGLRRLLRIYCCESARVTWSIMVSVGRISCELRGVCCGILTPSWTDLLARENRWWGLDSRRSSLFHQNWQSCVWMVYH